MGRENNFLFLYWIIHLFSTVVLFYYSKFHIIWIYLYKKVKTRKYIKGFEHLWGKMQLKKTQASSILMNTILEAKSKLRSFKIHHIYVCIYNKNYVGDNKIRSVMTVTMSLRLHFQFVVYYLWKAWDDRSHCVLLRCWCKKCFKPFYFNLDL